MIHSIYMYIYIYIYTYMLYAVTLVSGAAYKISCRMGALSIPICSSIQTNIVVFV